MGYSLDALSVFSSRLAALYTAGSYTHRETQKGKHPAQARFLDELYTLHRVAATAAPQSDNLKVLRYDRLVTHGLTPRECEVIRGVAEGLSDTQISARLCCSRKTVGKHVEHLLCRLGSETRLGAARRAEELLKFGC
jgi:DNA-binding NarL/FixJ family response regulator